MLNKKILIAEDNIRNAELLKAIVSRAGYSADVTYNGKEALDAISKNKYEALLTDWMMPKMDGIELIRNVRKSIKPVPIIVVLTALSTDEARKHALESGADDFIIKPYDPLDVINRLKNLFSRKNQLIRSIVGKPKVQYKIDAPFVGVCVAASSGGPQTLKKLFGSMIVTKVASFFIVQHSPAWILEDMAKNWKELFTMELQLASDGMKIFPGKVYLAPGGRHMIVERSPMKIRLVNDPPENFVKPAADPLFRSVAKSYGKRSIAVIMTGMGCDGAIGATYIDATKGVVIAQDPETAIVNSMPSSVIKTVTNTIVATPTSMPALINKYIQKAIQKDKS